MMRFTLFFAFVGLMAVLSGCDVDTPNGQIPTDYLTQAKAFSGQYRGSMQGGGKGVLTIALRGTQISASFRGEDILGRGCRTQLGLLQRVHAEGSGASARLTSAIFSLSSNCAEGSQLTLSLKSDGKSYSARVVKSSETTKSCPSLLEINDCTRQAQFDAQRNGKPISSAPIDSPFCRENGGLRGTPTCATDWDRVVERCEACNENTSYDYINGSFVK